MATTANHFKNGAVAVTIAVKAICAVQKRFGAKLIQFITDAVTAGTLTSAQGDQLKGMLTTVQDACDVWRLLTGY